MLIPIEYHFDVGVIDVISRLPIYLGRTEDAPNGSRMGVVVSHLSFTRTNRDSGAAAPRSPL